ncbi:MAG: acyl carrier protein [Candidatus Marinimicrobia bacterium]|nr:acyl carrier protein [Candidatus Neomarinimicrobiota bacterium]
MRLKILTAIISLLLCVSSFAQNSKSRAEFFKEFYGTYLNSTDIEVVKTENKVIPTVDLSDVISQLESRYNIDIPAEEEAKFTTVEEVAEYVNLYLQNQVNNEEPVVNPVKEPVNKPNKAYSWKYKLYGSYGLVEPLGVTGQPGGWNGNLGGAGSSILFDNMYTWEAGIMLHPYGWTGKSSQSPNSFGVSFDFASFDYIGTPDTSLINFNANDTTATRYAINLVFQQNLTGRKKARPKFSIYFEESIRLGVHSFGFINSNLYWNNHISYGIGLAQGINFLIFDLKFYEALAYSPDIMRVTSLSILQSLDFELGLRLGIALKL